MLLFENKIPSAYRSAFVSKVQGISSLLGIDANALMVVMNFESAGTFSPSVQNPSTKATGLIQFMPATAQSLGTTIEQLAAMSAIDQLDYVEKYLSRTQRERGNFVHMVDVYLAVFYPASIGKPLSYAYPDHVYRYNKGLDYNRDGVLTKEDIQNKILSTIPAEQAQQLKKKA